MQCHECLREMESADRKNLDGLMWLSPEEYWICPHCLNLKSAQVTVVVK